MNGGLTVIDMERRKTAERRAEALADEVSKLRELLVQAGQAISALQPNRPVGGILDRIEVALRAR